MKKRSDHTWRSGMSMKPRISHGMRDREEVANEASHDAPCGLKSIVAVSA